MAHHKILIIILASCASPSILIAIQAIIHRRSIIRTYRKVLHKLFPSTIPSWKIAMSVYHKQLGRPRFLSLHTLAAITGRNDLLALANEMKRSCEVSISFCSTVRSPVFVLREYRQENNPEVWKKIKDFIKEYPFPKYKGFYGAEGHWTGGSYGVGHYIPGKTAMTEPFIEQDYKYANAIIQKLRDAGRKVGISEYNI